MTPLQFAVACTHNRLFEWQVRCIKETLLSSNAALSYFINHEPSAKNNFNSKDEFDFFNFIKVEPKSFKESEVQFHFSDVPVLSDAADRDFQEVDFVICFCNVDEVSKLKLNPSLGFWFFYNRSIGMTSDSEISLNEIKERKPTTCIDLLIYEKRRNETFIFRSGIYKTIFHSISRNTDTVYLSCSKWISYAVREFSAGVIEFQNLQKITTHVTTVNNRYSIGLFLNLIKEKLKKNIRNLFIYNKWNVGVIENFNAEKLLAGEKIPQIRWLPEPAGQNFLADPFIVQLKGEYYLFYEDFIFKKNKGVISASNLEGANSSVVLDLNIHLSYPLIIKHDGATWCIPESNLLNEVAIYKVDENNFKLKKEKVLIENFDGVDNTIVYYNNKWWMCSTFKHEKGADTHLVIHYSDDLLGHWKPHKRNPVKIDISSARPAGNMFVIDSTLYRPAQNNSRTYGGSITIFKIIKLSENEFEEIVVRTIEPFDKKYKEGLHTISFCENFMVIDGKKKIIAFSKVFDLFS